VISSFQPDDLGWSSKSPDYAKRRSCRHRRLRTNQSFLGKGNLNPSEKHISMDWFQGKSTGNHRFFPLNMGLSCKFSLKPIHRILGGFPYHPPIILYGLRVLAQACQNSIRCWSWKGDSPLLTLFSLHLPTRCLGNPRNQWRRRSLGKSSHYFWGGWIPASHDWWHQRVPR